jgi:hypothetical protein
MHGSAHKRKLGKRDEQTVAGILFIESWLDQAVRIAGIWPVSVIFTRFSRDLANTGDSREVPAFLFCELRFNLIWRHRL